MKKKTEKNFRFVQTLALENDDFIIIMNTCRNSCYCSLLLPPLPRPFDECDYIFITCCVATWWVAYSQFPVAFIARLAAHIRSALEWGDSFEPSANDPWPLPYDLTHENTSERKSSLSPIVRCVIGGKEIPSHMNGCDRRSLNHET